MRKILLFLLLLMLPAFAITYVSPAGNDVTGDGSYATPYQTYSRAINLSTGNDVIYGIGGWFNEGTRITTGGKPNLTIVGNESARVIISVRSGICGMIFAGESSSLTFENLTIRGNGSTAWNCATGIQLGGGYENFTARNVILENFGTAGTTDAGIAQYANSSFTYNNIVLDNVTINRTQDYGFYAPNMVFNNTYFNHVAISTNSSIVGTVAGSRPQAYNWVIENSTFYCSVVNGCAGFQSLEATGWSPKAIFRNLQFGVPSQNYTGRLWRWRNGRDTLIQNITVFNGTYNTHMILFDLKSENITIDGLYMGTSAAPIDTPGGNMVYINNANKSTLKNIYINANRSTSVVRIDSDTYNVSDNVLENIFINGTNSSSAFTLQAGSTLTSGGRLENTTIRNINISMPQDGYGLTDTIFIGFGNFSVINNVSVTGNANGIRVEDNNFSMISNFSLYNNSYRGIWLNGGTNITLRDGFVFDQKNGTTAINITGISAARPSNRIDIARVLFNTTGTTNITLMSYLDGNVGFVSSNYNTFQYFNCSFGNFQNNSNKYNYVEFQNATGLELNSTFLCDLPRISIAVSLPINNSNYSTNSVTLNYSTVGPPQVCAYSLDGGANVTIASCANTTITPGFGNHTINLFVTDALGKSNASGVLNFLVDVFAPRLTVQSPTNGSNFTSSVPVNFIVSENLTSVTCSYSLDNTANVSLPGCANTSLTPSPGRHNIFIYANDTVGNLNVSSNISFMVDPFNPELTVQSPINNSNFSINSVPLNYVARDNLSGIDRCFYSLDGGANVMLPACANTTLVPGRGRHSLFVFVNDTLGNLNSSGNITFTVDVFPPGLSVQSPINNSNFTGSVALNFIVSENLTSVTCAYSLDLTANVSIANCANTSISPAEGRHTIIIFANDTVGNLNSSQRNFTVDPSAPFLNVSEPVNGSSYEFPTLNFTVRDATSPIDSCFYSVNATANVSIPGCLNISLPFFQPGNYFIQVFANDTLGNLNSSPIINFTMNSSISVRFSSPRNGSAVYSKNNITAILDVSTNVPMINCTIMTNYTSITFPANASNTIVLTPPISGVYNITATCGSPGDQDSDQITIGYLLLRSYSVNFKPGDYSYTSLVTYVQGFYNDYLDYILAIFAYGIAYMFTSKYQDTIIAGGVGCFVVFFITGNPVLLAGGILSVLVGYILKYAGG